MQQIVLLGGDARMVAAAAAFSMDGEAAHCLWMENCPCPQGEVLGQQLRLADAVVLPLPALTKDGRVRASCATPAPAWEEIRGWLRADCLVCGGGLQTIQWPRTVDFMTDEGFALANAVPTALAEGADKAGLYCFQRS